MPSATDLSGPRYADPHRCPDCRRFLPVDDRVRCGTCGLPLLGQTAAELFGTLQSADRLLAQLRSQQPAATPAPALPWVSPFPLASQPASVRPSRAWTVPGVLLALGALCLLVGAAVFLAVTWTMLGVGGRTAVLVGVTALAGASTALAARHGLRGAAEALSLVSGSLLALDLAGAYPAGWFGDVAPVSALLVGSLVVTLAMTAATELLSRCRVGRFVSTQALAAASAVVATGAALARWDHTATAIVVTVALLGAGLTTQRRHQPVLAVGLLVAAALAWLVLLAEGLVRVLDGVGDGATLAAWGDVTPLLWAAALLGLLTAPVPPTLVRRLAVVGACGLTGLACALALVTGPDGLVGVALAGTLACTLVAVADPGRWTAPAFAASAVGFALVGLVPALLTGAGLAVAIVEVGNDARMSSGALATTVDSHLHPFVVGSGWTIPVGVVGVVLAVVGFGRRRPPGAWTVALVSLPVAGLTVLAYLPSLLLAVAGAVVLAGLHAVAAARRVTAWGRGLDVVAAIAWTLAAAAVATYHPVPALGVASLYAAVATLVALRGSAVAAALAPVLVAATGAAFGWLGDWPATWVALGVVVTGCAHALLVGVVGRRRGMGGLPRLWGYASALSVALPTGLVSASFAAPDRVADRMVAALVVIGVAAAAVAILERTREAAWLAAGLQVGALWLRLVDADVRTTEAYSLPLAGALLVFGAWTLWRDPEVSTSVTLLPGLGAALVPTLVVTATDPASLRAALLAVGCAAVLTLGVVGRLRAPLLVGAATGAVLALVELAPYHDAVPRWLALSAAGLVLLVSGVRWEHLATVGRRTWGHLAALR